MNKHESIQNRVCELCGNMLKRRKRDSAAQWESRRFCSQQCSNRSHAKTPIDQRFWNFVKKSTNHKCWIWLGNSDRSGYGMIATERGKSPIRAHRLSWEIAFGSIPPGLQVCHACDNPSCVNPNHLMLGTLQANLLDASRKGRINDISISNLRPSAPGFYGAGPHSNKELSHGISK